MWFGPVGDCSCLCRCPELDCGDGTTQNIKQISFTVNLPDEIEVWSGPLGPNDKTWWKGLSALNGTYLVNRKPYPDCEWEWDETPITVTRERYNGNSSTECTGLGRFCPVDGTHTFFDTTNFDIHLGNAGPSVFHFYTPSNNAWMKFSKDTSSNCGIQDFTINRDNNHDWQTLKANPCADDGTFSCYSHPNYQITGEFLQ